MNYFPDMEGWGCSGRFGGPGGGGANRAGNYYFGQNFRKTAWKWRKTRMHSSRRRTARLLTVSQHVLLRGWVYLPGGYLPRGGCTCLGGVPAKGWGTCPRGCTCLGGCTCPGVYLPRYSPLPPWTESQLVPKVTVLANSIGGSKGGARDACPPPGVQILSFSCSFRQKVEK